MGRTRDIIQEIADVRQRRRFGSAMAELPLRLFSLEMAFKNLNKNDREIFRYFPVALIACIEGYFRIAIKDLVDSGEPFLSNAEKAATSFKLDFNVIRAVHGKTITVGELVAHGAQLSRLEHINSALTGITGRDFLDSLSATKDRWAHEVLGKPADPILSNPCKVYSDVARTFELRHIICHEIASAYEIEFDEVAQCFESCVAFLKASDELISETIQPGAPLTQSDMNIAVSKSLDERRSELDEALASLKSRLSSSEIDALEDSQEKWQHYCDAWSSFVASECEGGTIWPVIYGGAAESIVLKRIEELNNFKRLGDSA